MGNCFYTSDSVNTSDSVKSTYAQPSINAPVNALVQVAEPVQVAVIQPSINVNSIVVTDVYKDCTDENTPYYSYENIKKMVKVLRVIDGDTVDIAFYHDEMNRVFKYRVRMYGIDTPEKRPLKSNVNRDKEIEGSKASTAALTSRLQENNYMVIALFYKPDKYGRLLATFYDKNGEDLNKWMVESGFAYSYFGQTKRKYDDVLNEQVNKLIKSSDNRE